MLLFMSWEYFGGVNQKKYLYEKKLTKSSFACILRRFL